MYIVYFKDMTSKILKRQLPTKEEALQFAKKSGERSTVMCCILVDANNFEIVHSKY